MEYGVLAIRMKRAARGFRGRLFQDPPVPLVIGGSAVTGLWATRRQPVPRQSLVETAEGRLGPPYHSSAEHFGRRQPQIMEGDQAGPWLEATLSMRRPSFEPSRRVLYELTSPEVETHVCQTG